MRLTVATAEDRHNRQRCHRCAVVRHRTMAVAGFALLTLMPAMSTPAHAAGDPLYLTKLTFARCVAKDIQASFALPESTYEVKGVCGLFEDHNDRGKESTFGQEGHIRDYPWTAKGKYNASTKATSELLIITDMETRSIPSFDSTMQCPQDPWLNALSQPCLDIRDRTARVLNDNIRQILSVLWGLKINVPYSSLITADRRAALNVQQAAWRAGVPKSKLPGPLVQQPPSPPPQLMNPQLKNMSIPDGMFIITRPAAGDRVAHGQLILTATSGKAGAPNPNEVTEVELRFLDAPPAQQNSYPYLQMLSVGTTQLLRGYPVTEFVTGGYVGRWQVRARLGMKTSPGPWGPPVQFQMVKGQSSPPPPPVAQPQVKRSPLMIRPRGVEGESDSQPGESPAAGIK